MINEQIAMERLRPIDINQPGHAQRHHGPLGPRAPRSLVLRQSNLCCAKLRAMRLCRFPKPFDFQARLLRVTSLESKIFLEIIRFLANLHHAETI